MADLRMDLPEHPTNKDLEEELIFQGLMMDGLDSEADDYIQKRAGVEEKIDILNRMLGIDNETLSHGGLTQDLLSPTSVMSPGAMSQGAISQESWDQMPLRAYENTSNQYHDLGNTYGGGGGGSNRGFTDLNAMAPPTNGGGNEYNWMLDGMYEDTAASAASASASYPTFIANVDTMSRKRPHHEVSSQSVAFTSNKSMRASLAATPPRPTTRPASPSSDSSLEIIEQAFARQNGNWQLGNGSTSDARVAAMLRTQREAEAQARQREAQRKQLLERDRRLAASLAGGSSFSRSSGSSSSSQQAVLNRDGTYRRPQSQLKTEQNSNAPNPYFKTEPSMSGSSTFAMQPNQYPTKRDSRSIKAEQPQASSWAQGNQVWSVESGEDDDSDVEVIDATQFARSARGRQTSMQNAKTRLYQHHLQPAYNNQGHNQPLSRQQSVISNGGFQENPATLHDLMNPYGSNKYRQSSYSMPGALSGAFNGYGSIGSSRHAQVIDLEEDDEDEAPSTAFNYLYSDSSKTADEIKALIENIAAGGEVPPEMRGNAPEAMAGPLFEHQKIGLKWLKEKEEGDLKGGILADDMGLGKTVQAIALMAARPSTDPLRKTTLIIAPVALLKQWEAEIRDKLRPTHAMKVHKHHGSGRKSTFRDLRQYDVVLTTFGTLATELKRKEHWDKVLKNNPHALPQPAEVLALLGNDCLWYRVIIDEAQCIKNKGTHTAKAAYSLKAKYRWCMTGTPMMNNVSELFSLIHFCRIKPYNDAQKFKNEIATPLSSQHDSARTRAMQKLQGLIKAVMLRRTKYSQLDGRPIITLPDRVTETANVDFSEDEQDFYQALESKTQIAFNKYLKQGSVMKNYANVLVLLLRLRQACCHPHLIRDYATAITTEVTPETMDDLAKELSEDVVARIKESEGTFECPICYDGVENPAIFIPCGHDACSECFTRLLDPARGLAQGNESADAKCPECRGKLDPKRIIDYNAFKKAHMPEDLPEEERFAGLADVADETDSDSDTDSDSEPDEDGSLSGFIVNDEDVDNEDFAIPGAPTNSKPQKGEKKRKLKSNSKGKKKAKDVKSLAQLRSEGLRNKKARRKYIRRLKKDYVNSAKIEKVLDILTKVHEVAVNPKPSEDQIETNGEKVLIFSQFTSLLDLLEIPIQTAGYQYTRYDGSMSPADRNQSVISFKENPQCRVMLVSLKAGNAGLNLIAASQVIILDPFWNPYIAEQAIDRAHRIGQRRQVTVHHVLVPGTVEDRIVQLQEKKRLLISSALDENAGQNVGKLGERELGYLFGVNGYSNG